MPTTETRNRVVAPKDPENASRRGVQFADLLPDGVTLTSAQIVAIVPEGLSASGELPATATVSGSRATDLFTGGSAGVSYAITFRGTYSDGQTRDVTIILPVRER